MEKNEFFKFSKTKIVIFFILFFLFYFYFPSVKCISNINTSKKVCEKHNLCSTDYWFSMFNIVSNYKNYGNRYYCPEKNFSHFEIILLTLIFLFLSYILASLIEIYYKRRDI